MIHIKDIKAGVELIVKCEIQNQNGILPAGKRAYVLRADKALKTPKATVKILLGDGESNVSRYTEEELNKCFKLKEEKNMELLEKKEKKEKKEDLVIGINVNFLEESKGYTDIEKAFTRGRVTVVILKNGCKGISKCDPKDEFDSDKGIGIAYRRAILKSYKLEYKARLEYLNEISKSMPKMIKDEKKEYKSAYSELLMQLKELIK